MSTHIKSGGRPKLITQLKSRTSKNKSAVQDIYRIRRWILTVVSKAAVNGGLTLNHIKKYLDSKKNGLSNRPEVKIILKRAIDTGHLIKVDGKYMTVEKPIQKLSPESLGARIKVLEDVVLTDPALEDASNRIANLGEVKRSSSSRQDDSGIQNAEQVTSKSNDGDVSIYKEGENTGLQGAGSSVTDGSVTVDKAKKKRKSVKRITEDGGIEAGGNIKIEKKQMSLNKTLLGGGDASTASETTEQPKKKRSRKAEE